MADCRKIRGSIERSKKPPLPLLRTITPRRAKVTHTAEDATAHRNQHGFGQERPDDTAAGRANRRADRDLVLAGRPLRDHQDRDIRAGDEDVSNTAVPST